MATVSNSSIDTKKIIWDVDSVHSTIEFSVSHMMISQLTGYFRTFEGRVITIGENFDNADVEIVIKSSSIETNNIQRNRHLISEDFLSVILFPEIVFKSNQVEKIENNQFIVSGILTIKNVSKHVEFKVQHNGTIKDPHNNRRAGIKVTGEVNRKDFEINWTGMLETGGLIVGNKVELVALIELVHK